MTSSSGNGVATGSVTYQDGSTTLRSISLNSKGEAELVSGGFPSLGAAICLSAGTHSISASYSGDNSLNPATGQPLTFTVTKGSAFVVISTSQTTIAATQQLLSHSYIKGSASAIPPTGTVQFMDGNTPLGSPVPIPAPDSGITPQVDFQSSLSVGTHTISATYSGDNNYNPASALNTVTVNVTTAVGRSTQTTLTTSSASPTVGQVVNYVVAVSGPQSTPVPTGTVQLMNGTLGTLGPVTTLVKGSATIPIQWAFGGTQSLSAQYSGDSSYATSASTPIMVAVKTATPSVTVSTSSPTVNSGTQVSLTTTVAVLIRPIVGGGIGIGGEVQFFDSLNGGPSQSIGAPVVLVPVTTDPAVPGWFGFVATSVLPVFLKDGAHEITAQYLGDGSYSSVTSGPVGVSVGARKNSQSTLTVDSTSPAFGQSLRFTATVTTSQLSPAPTGSVQFISPTLGVVGTSSLQNGSAAISIPWSAGGFQAVMAQYSGDTNYASSNSNTLTITLPSFEFTAGANQLPIPSGTNAAAILRIAPIAGFQSIAVLSCGSGIPVGSTCSISPSSVTLDGMTSATAVFSLTTVSPSANTRPLARSAPHLWWGFGASAGLAGLGLIILPGGKTRSKYVVTLMLLGLFAGVVACGGGGGSGGGNAGGGGSNGGSSGGGGNGGVGSNPVASTTALTSSAIKTPASSPITFTAAVSSLATAVTGNVTFYDGATQIGQSPISNGQAQLLVTLPSVGTHSITAKYNGDSLNSASTSTPLNQVITGSVQFPITATAGAQTRTITMNVLIE